MCQKTNITKRFFVLVNQGHTFQSPQVLAVLKETPQVRHVFDTTKYSSYLMKRDVLLLGKTPPPMGKDYLLPIEIPRDWFLH